jgi:excisionase family DNA binding protein
MMPGLNLDQVLDALADKVADRLRDGGASAPAGSIRPRLLTVEQAAVYLSRSKASVQHLVASGKVPTVRSDRRVFIDAEDLDAWIREHKQGAV